MAAIEPRVMTLQEFKNNSTPANIAKRSRGPELQIIDLQLETFQGSRLASVTSPLLSQQLANQVLIACKAWLTKKQAKATQNAQNRRDAINQLGTQVFEWLQYQRFQDKKKTNPKGSSTLRSMAPGYIQERTLYEQQGKKANPISASYINAAMDAHPNGYNSKTFSQLDAKDFQNLDTAYCGSVPTDVGVGLADPGSMAKTKVPRLVLFLKKQDRIKLLIMIEAGLLYETFNKPFDFTFKEIAYVIDQYGNLYSTTQILDQGSSFNHSTFNAGKDVICAGTLKVNQGQLNFLSNKSGHYKPTRQNLQNAAEFLHGAGVNLSATRIVVSEPDPARAGKLIEHEYINGDNFRQNPNSAPSRSFPEP